MSTQYSPKIVTDGLVLSLDAGNPLSYPGSGTTWTDLSGNSNNGTLTNGPTFNSTDLGSIVFDGTNDYVNIPFPSSFSTFPSFNFSIGLWLNLTSLIGADLNIRILDITTSTSPQNTFQITGTNNANTLQIRVNRNGTTFGKAMSAGTTPLSNWISIMSTWDNTSNVSTLYINNVNQPTLSTGTPTPGVANSINIGRRSDGNVGTYMNGKVSNFMMYNRLLTFNEILQNYNATKWRFGL